MTNVSCWQIPYLIMKTRLESVNWHSWKTFLSAPSLTPRSPPARACLCDPCGPRRRMTRLSQRANLYRFNHSREVGRLR